MTALRGDGSTPIEGVTRNSRHLSRQGILNEKRQNHVKRLRATDMLSSLESSAEPGAENVQPLHSLRDENRRLRRELEFLQHRIAQQREAEARIDEELETIHHAYELKIEQYQNGLRDMMEELNQKQSALQDLERRYQNLDQNFQEAVEEETKNILDEAAQTMALSPDYVPPILYSVMDALRLKFKRMEDQHVAEIMALMRQTQRKNDLLEQELARERESITQEHEQLVALHQNLLEQNKARQQYMANSLRYRFIGLVAIVSTALVVICVFAQLILIEYFKLPQFWALFSPILLCVLLSLVFARSGSKPNKRKRPK